MAFAGIVLVVNAVLIAFVLPFYIAMIVTIGSGVLMFALPTVNYIRSELGSLFVSTTIRLLTPFPRNRYPR